MGPTRRLDHKNPRDPPRHGDEAENPLVLLAHQRFRLYRHLGDDGLYRVHIVVLEKKIRRAGRQVNAQVVRRHADAPRLVHRAKLRAGEVSRRAAAVH